MVDKETEKLNVPIDQFKQGRIDLMLMFINNLNNNKQPSYTREEMYIWFSNIIYLTIEGTREERLELMKSLNIPEFKTE